MNRFRAFKCSVLATLDALLTPRRVFLFPVLLLSLTLIAYLIPIFAGRPPFDAYGDPIAGDLYVQLAGARMVTSGDARNLYDLEAQWTTKQAILGGGNLHGLSPFTDPFAEPPVAALLYIPFAVFPYLLAAALWTIFSTLLVAASLMVLWPLPPSLHRHGYARILVLAFSTMPFIQLLNLGQDSAVVLFLLAAGLRLLVDGHDVGAGAVLGLGVFKPQLFLLVPVLLLFQGRRRALGGWLAVAAILAGLSVALLGPVGVRSYLQLLKFSFGLVRIVLYAIGPSLGSGAVVGLAWSTPSLFGLDHVVNVVLPAPAAMAATAAIVALGAFLLVWWGRRCLKPARRRQEFELMYAGMVLVGVMDSPHFLPYDAVVLMLPALILFEAAPSSPGIHVLLAAAYLMTWGCIMRVGPGFGHSPLMLIIAVWTLVPTLVLFVATQRLLRRDDASEPLNARMGTVHGPA